MMMPIETIPEQKTLSGPELEAAITDGIQRAIGRRVNNIRICFADGRVIETQLVRISVDVVGSLKWREAWREAQATRQQAHARGLA